MLRPNWALVVVIFIVFIGLQFLVNVVFPKKRLDCSQCHLDAGKPSANMESPTSEVLPLREGRIKLETPPPSEGERANAAIVILARNSDVSGLQKSISKMEERFNRQHGYPYVFLNDVPFDDNFKSEMAKLSSNPMEFGTIPKEHWSYPEWINVTRADAARADMGARHIIYGDSLSYRHMCRYNSGFFFRHPLLSKYEYYWRVEPGVDFFCNLNYDPFMFMKKSGKTYGFVIMLHEYTETIPTLWETTKRFMNEHKSLIPAKNSLKMLQNADGTFNGCHFWSNFEIAHLEFFRSEPYLKYFEYLDKAGGFFYERWGDAPVHSIALSMFLEKEKLHYFEDIGYYHVPFYNCPSNPSLQKNCECDPEKNVNKDHGCFKEYLKLQRNL